MSVGEVGEDRRLKIAYSSILPSDLFFFSPETFFYPGSSRAYMYILVEKVHRTALSRALQRRLHVHTHWTLPSDQPSTYMYSTCTFMDERRNLQVLRGELSVVPR